MAVPQGPEEGRHKMIHWSWAVIAFTGGVVLGFFVAVLFLMVDQEIKYAERWPPRPPDLEEE